jgi:hypothetical protein
MLLPPQSEVADHAERIHVHRKGSLAFCPSDWLVVISRRRIAPSGESWREEDTLAPRRPIGEDEYLVGPKRSNQMRSCQTREYSKSE